MSNKKLSNPPSLRGVRMKKILLAASMLTALALPAKADVIVQDKLSGTGDNVIFDSAIPGSLVIGSFNGQHQGLVDFTCISTCSGFTGASNGNDIKITAAGLTNMQIQVFDTTGLNVLATATDVFSI